MYVIPLNSQAISIISSFLKSNEVIFNTLKLFCTYFGKTPLATRFTIPRNNIATKVKVTATSSC